jgi:hypothetical protein
MPPDPTIIDESGEYSYGKYKHSLPKELEKTMASSGQMNIEGLNLDNRHFCTYPFAPSPFSDESQLASAACKHNNMNDESDGIYSAGNEFLVRLKSVDETFTRNVPTYVEVNLINIS